ncbi:hypothetical protein [Clostridium disporicum]|uniref:DUF5673 domain-containing protein n=1 Tax=Clostridium disporicum TaxID=84024 RepID=A0A173XV73_9CLOT|nr:hypothetical protein [Clostridium disporicum]CUN55170.1 Uncharacterised protein [Clostridium disporicum]
MNTFISILFTILFIGVPTYYFTILFSSYYKQVRKNKDKIKVVLNVRSYTTYLAAIVLVIATIAFGIYSLFNKTFVLLLIPMILIDILVYFLIKLSSSKFYIFDNFLIIKNFYVEFSEIKNVLLKPENKDNLYELSISTKDFLHTIKIKTEDPKSLIKEFKTSLPKNIKIKEVPAK